jgi:hypothetical protein
MIVYENEGHRRRMMRTYHQFAWKMLEWRKDPHCRKCGRLTYIYPDPNKSWKDQATVDHIISRGQGGSDTEDNFELLCSKCNNDKSKGENPVKFVKIDEKQHLALVRKAEILDALRKEGVKKLPIWEAAQNRLKNAIDNSGTEEYNACGLSKDRSDEETGTGTNESSTP